VSALTRFFFSSVYAPRSMWTVINWWESRRAIYNLAVGAAGMGSLTLVWGFAVLPPYPAHFVVPLPAILVYAILANLFYCAGPLVDVLIRRKWGNSYAAVGPTLFRYGFAFALGLTLLPVPLALLSWCVRLLRLLA
jgi:hypothetical protein